MEYSGFTLRQKVDHWVKITAGVAALAGLPLLIYSACDLYVVSNEQVESPGSHLFHSLAAGVGSVGSACFGQVGAAIPLGVDSANQLFDFFGASSAKTAHEKRVAAAEDLLTWSFLGFVGAAALWWYRQDIADVAQRWFG